MMPNFPKIFIISPPIDNDYHYLFDYYYQLNKQFCQSLFLLKDKGKNRQQRYESKIKDYIKKF